MSNTQEQSPQPAARPDIPEPLKQLEEQAKHTARAHNEAVESGNSELAAELKAKLNELIESAQNEAKNIGVLDSSPYQIWIEVHNNSSWQTLKNRGRWTGLHGWYDSPAVGNIPPGGVAYIHMGGIYPTGCDTTAYFGYDEGPDGAIFWDYGPGIFSYGCFPSKWCSYDYKGDCIVSFEMSDKH
ncbi:hypothetical protein BDW59DRAFT_152931 [Aspergillus cavernicola]|uniref:Uncharacterized protein n=1 Tax=Aspergillus cavernicola TaxID=176166 RepID=A0ABR4HNE3_9EURO